MINLANLRWRPIILVTLLVSVFGALISNRSKIAELLLAPMVREARENGIVLSLEDPSLQFFGVGARKLYFQPPGVPILLTFDDVHVAPALSALLSGTLRGTWDAFFYGGHLTGSVESPAASSILLSLELTDALLAPNQQLQALGFRSGRLSASVQSLILDAGVPSAGAITLHLREFDQAQAMLLPASVTGLPGDMTLPALGKGTLSCTFNFATRGTLSWSDCTLQSDLTTILSSGEMTDTAVSLAADVLLHDRGAAEFSSIVALLSANAIPENVQHFAVTAKGPRGMPKLQWIPVPSAK